jgi:MFS family permease
MMRLSMRPEPLAKLRFDKIVITAVLGLGQAVAYASSFYLFGVLGDPIAKDLAIAPSVVYVALSMAFLVSALLGPSIGKWMDGHGGREVLLASNAVFAAALALLSQASGSVGVVAGILMIGVGMSMGLSQTPFAILASMYGAEARRSMTGVTLIGGLGGAIGWPVTLVLVESFTWRGAALGWALVHVALCLPIAALIIPRTHGRGATAKSPSNFVWDRRATQLAVLFAGAWFISTAMSAHLPRVLFGVGLTAEAAANTAALLGIAAVSVRALDVLFLNRLPAVVTARFATLCHPVGAIAVLLAGAPAAPLLALGQGAGNGILSASTGVLPLVIFGKEGFASRNAMILFPARLIQSAGPAMYGFALAHSTTSALLLSSSVCAVMFLMTFRLGETHPAY